jgi:hypothetical protein
MNPPDDEATIKDLVRRLFQAENSQNEQDADQILASDYLPITRGSGQVDQSRKHTLKEHRRGISFVYSPCRSGRYRGDVLPGQ